MSGQVLDYKASDIEVPAEFFRLDRETREMAREMGVKLKDLMMLDPKNSPRSITPKKIEWAKFATYCYRQYVAITNSKEIHHRGLHYFTERTHMVLKPDGEIYANTIKDWDKMDHAVSWGRYLGLIPWWAIPDLYTPAGKTLNAEPEPDSDRDSISAAELMMVFKFAVMGNIVGDTYAPQGDSEWVFAMFCEKASLTPFIRPLAREFNINYYPGKGESTAKAIERMLNDSQGKNLWIIVISDYDIAGKSIPVAIAAKADYFHTTGQGESVPPRIILEKVLLNRDQVIQYNLSPSPAKESDQRKTKWVEREGFDEVVELDSILGVPGAFETILRDRLSQIIDLDALNRIREANRRVAEEVAAMLDFLEPWAGRMARLLEGTYLNARVKHEPDRTMIPPTVPDDVLYDSDRTWVQNLYYAARFKKKGRVTGALRPFTGL